MKKRVKIIVALIVISLMAVSCKAPCGCKGGYGEVNSVGHQIEQRA